MPKLFPRPRNHKRNHDQQQHKDADGVNLDDFVSFGRKPEDKLKDTAGNGVDGRVIPEAKKDSLWDQHPQKRPQNHSGNDPKTIIPNDFAHRATSLKTDNADPLLL
jgi:hypothetical protein